MLEIWQWEIFVRVGGVKINASVAAVHVDPELRAPETKGGAFCNILACKCCVIAFPKAYGWIILSTALLSLVLEYTSVDIDFNIKPKIKIIVCHLCTSWECEYAIIERKFLRVKVKISRGHRVFASLVCFVPISPCFFRIRDKLRGWNTFIRGTVVCVSR